MSKEQGKVRFIRKRGRIIPIRSSSKSGSKRAAKDIFSKKNARELGTIGAALAGGAGGLFAAGRIERKSQSLAKIGKFKSASTLNRIAKFTKFGSKVGAGLAAAGALTAIDRKSRDEGTIFDIGNKKGAFNLGVAVIGGYAAARFGKRFEKLGLRGGKFPMKLKDI